MVLSICLLIFVGNSIQISSREENKNMSDSSLPATSVDSYKIVSALSNKMLEEQKRRTFRIIFSRVKLGKNETKKFIHRRIKRSIGSVKVQGLMKPRDEDDSYQSAPPSLIALVFLDIIAGIFTFNAIAALLFVANS